MKCFFKNLNNFLNNECNKKKNILVINHKKQIPERHREVDCNSAAVLRYSLKNTKKFINNLAITH